MPVYFVSCLIHSQATYPHDHHYDTSAICVKCTPLPSLPIHVEPLRRAAESADNGRKRVAAQHRDKFWCSAEESANKGIGET